MTFLESGVIVYHCDISWPLWDKKVSSKYFILCTRFTDLRVIGCRVHEWTLSAAFLYLYLCFCNCICAQVLYCIILYCIVLYLCTCICIRINLPVIFSYPEWTFSFSCTSGVTSEQSCIMSIFLHRSFLSN